MRKFLVPAAIFLLVVVVMFAGYVLSEWKSYHNFEDMCGACHLNDPWEKDKPLVFTKDISALCFGCHEDIKELSHPVDVEPDMEVPWFFPLDWKGDLTCTSCHTTHRQGYGRYNIRVNFRGEGLCILCHNDLNEEIHTTTIASVHITDAPLGRYDSGALNYYLDELSMRCLTCHDAVFGKDADIEKPRAGGDYSHTKDLGISHPIGVSYVDISMRWQGAYRRPEDLPRGIRLFNGTVGCCSCHNPYSERHYDLVMSNDGSALCFACHRK
ncbi:MAG: cytochrome c3 family protein [Deltaproteobacteria bacterium]|nr:cytochrome c3 family protein [Deltaproteobacteria bacterium]